ncbi:hypothetical protein [Deinococcus yavapaiensis]|uniref:Uncharacterized protein n=1 Tax=Deinococcus yavapaiensis KR-236 TaxID=694435 RepID=A0A318S3K7_9DEIO|nr:hypothetical protein [Deinococcus yavapaiensis]PYE50949.1 hypothetical protein DES52_11616 [Deinococcus yavapaiensis KR-236]
MTTLLALPFIALALVTLVCLVVGAMLAEPIIAWSGLPPSMALMVTLVVTGAR